MTSLLHRVIRAHRCTSTHHHIAINAINLLNVEDNARWRDWLLVQHEDLLKGAKAPDAEFKDFKNHVLHIGEGEWGGARDAAMEWYSNAVEALKKKDWPRAAYCLGVLSHYYADPIQPFHTGQTEAEGIMHRALEWSIAKLQTDIQSRIDASGYPNVEAPDGLGFVSDMVRAGAEKSHPHYQTFIDHYNIDRGAKVPEEGMDAHLIDVVTDLVAYATSGLATIFSKAIEEAGVKAPRSAITLNGYLSTLDIPIRWITRKLGDMQDRAIVERMYKEYKKTGKVIKSLPEDDREIRLLHARQVRRISKKELDAEKPAPIGSKHLPMVPRTKSKKLATGRLVHPSKEVLEAENGVKDILARFIPAPNAPVFDEADQPEIAAAPSPAPQPEPAPEEEDVAALATLAATEALAEDIDTADTTAFESDEDSSVNAFEAEFDASSNDEDDSDFDAGDADQVLGEADLEDEIADSKDTLNAMGGARDVRAMQDFARHFAEELRESHDQDDDDDEFDADEDDELLQLEHSQASDSEPEDVVQSDAVPEDFEGLRFESDIVDAPSIGPKTAAHFYAVGVDTISDLLDADAKELSAKMNIHYITADRLSDWQDQCWLKMDVPSLRTHDVQLLVGAGIRSAEDLISASAKDLFEDVLAFVTSPEGRGVMRDGDRIEEEEIYDWIEQAITANG